MRDSLEEAVASDDPRRALTAIRDFLVHELEVNRCNTCMASKLRTGDTAALVLRLTDILEKIEQLPRNDGQVSDLDRIRARKSARTPNAQDPPRPATGGVPRS